MLNTNGGIILKYFHTFVYPNFALMPDRVNAFLHPRFIQCPQYKPFAYPFEYGVHTFDTD